MKENISNARCYLLFILPILLSLLTACGDEEPVKIGFVGGLTGRHADLGLYGRDGAMLAVEEQNLLGGIDGRHIELITRDDKQDPLIAAEMTQDLVDQRVVAIVGHFTSDMSVAGRPVTERAKVLMFSPTTTTSELTGIDDHFFRVIGDSIAATMLFANKVFFEDKVKRLVIVYDKHNKSYSRDWVRNFKVTANSAGCEVMVIGYSAEDEKLKFSHIAEEIVDLDSDAVLMVSSALDTAMICQQLRKVTGKIRLYSTMWAMTEDFLQHAGTAAEGVVLANWFYRDHPGKKSIAFRKRFVERYNRPANFAAHFSYEVSKILIDTLLEDENPKNLKANILAKGNFTGTQGNIIIDKFGDSERSLFLMQVKDGRFSVLR